MFCDYRVMMLFKTCYFITFSGSYKQDINNIIIYFPVVFAESICLLFEIFSAIKRLFKYM